MSMHTTIYMFYGAELSREEYDFFQDNEDFLHKGTTTIMLGDYCSGKNLSYWLGINFKDLGEDNGFIMKIDQPPDLTLKDVAAINCVLRDNNFPVRLCNWIIGSCFG